MAKDREPRDPYQNHPVPGVPFELSITPRVRWWHPRVRSDPLLGRVVGDADDQVNHLGEQLATDEVPVMPTGEDLGSHRPPHSSERLLEARLEIGVVVALPDQVSGTEMERRRVIQNVLPDVAEYT